MKDNLLIYNQYNLNVLLNIIKTTDFKKYYILMENDSLDSVLNLNKKKFDEIMFVLPKLDKYFDAFKLFNGMNLEYEDNLTYIKILFMDYLSKFNKLFEKIKQEKEIYILNNKNYDIMEKNNLLYNYELLFDFSIKENIYFYFKWLDKYKGYEDLHFTLIIPNDLDPLFLSDSFKFKHNIIIIKNVFYGDDFKMVKGIIKYKYKNDLLS